MSSPPLRIFLNTEEERTLWELRRGKNIPQRTEDRAQAVRLSAQGWRVEKISHYLKCSPSTVCSTLHRWKEKGLAGLWDAPRSGRNKKWQISDITAVEEKLETEQRTYNSKQLRQFLVMERQISLSERQLRRIIKKNFLWKRTRTSHKAKQNLTKKEIGQADLDMLELAAAAGEIHLKYLDESGFSLWAQVCYTRAKKGEQKRIEQTKKKGKRLNICAFWEIKVLNTV